MAATSKMYLSLFIYSVSVFQLSSAFEVFQQKVIVNSSELSILIITPALFGWDIRPDTSSQIEYNARISQAPDLPKWLHYTYDGPTSTGYLYGVPPLNVGFMDLDVIAWNRQQSYEVRKLIISLDIVRKPKFDFIVELKIDNLNVKDLCNPRRMNRILNIFSNFLDWTHEDGSPVTPVYMASAVELGENPVPLRPNEAEGVVVHLGSNKNFSAELYKLQSEVLPLWKLRPCPRDLKRTSMEKYFRGQGVLSDWCSFQLTTTPDTNEINSEENMKSHPGIVDEDTEDSDSSQKVRDDDIFYFKTSIPERGYGVGILLATIVPGTIGGLVGFLLVALLWADRDETVPVNGDELFFEAAFRMLKTLFRKENGNNGNGNTVTSQKQERAYQHYRPPSLEEDFVLITGEDERFVPTADDREATPLPPQYGATHPNGSPALTYAV